MRHSFAPAAIAGGEQGQIPASMAGGKKSSGGEARLAQVRVLGLF